MPANIRDTQISIGIKKQTAVGTANIQAELRKISKLNADLANVAYGTEPADEIGSGTEFTSVVDKTTRDTSFSIEKVLTSQWAAFVFAFGFGKATKSGASSPFTYTCVPTVPATDCVNLLNFTYLESVPTCGGGGDILNRALIGCSIGSFTLTVEKGASRSSSRLSVNCVGTGKTDEAPTLTHPSSTLAETRLPASSLTLTINGTNYVTGGLIESVEFGWDNAPRLEDGYFPGSGSQDGFAIRGRMEHGSVRIPTLSFTARAAATSPELTKLKALTEGTAVLTLSESVNHSLSLTLHRVIYGAVEFPEANGIVAVRVTCTPMWHSTNGLVTAVVVTDLDTVAQ